MVDLGSSIGSEIHKTRPCVIISPDEMNKFLRTLIVAPMTTNLKTYPTRVKVKHDGKTGRIAIDQIRTIDRRRVLKISGKLDISEIRNMKSIIKETLVD